MINGAPQQIQSNEHEAPTSSCGFSWIVTRSYFTTQLSEKSCNFGRGFRMAARRLGSSVDVKASDCLKVAWVRYLRHAAHGRARSGPLRKR